MPGEEQLAQKPKTNQPTNQPPSGQGLKNDSKGFEHKGREIEHNQGTQSGACDGRCGGCPRRNMCNGKPKEDFFQVAEKESSMLGGDKSETISSAMQTSGVPDIAFASSSSIESVAQSSTFSTAAYSPFGSASCFSGAFASIDRMAIERAKDYLSQNAAPAFAVASGIGDLAYAVASVKQNETGMEQPPVQSAASGEIPFKQSFQYTPQDIAQSIPKQEVFFQESQQMEAQKLKIGRTRIFVHRAEPEIAGRKDSYDYAPDRQAIVFSNPDLVFSEETHKHYNEKGNNGNSPILFSTFYKAPENNDKPQPPDGKPFSPRVKVVTLKKEKNRRKEAKKLDGRRQLSRVNEEDKTADRKNEGKTEKIKKAYKRLRMAEELKLQQKSKQKEMQPIKEELQGKTEFDKKEIERKKIRKTIEDKVDAQEKQANERKEKADAESKVKKTRANTNNEHRNKEKLEKPDVKRSQKKRERDLSLLIGSNKRKKRSGKWL